MFSVLGLHGRSHYLNKYIGILALAVSSNVHLYLIEPAFIEGHLSTR
jgi:hypothetical protein